MAENKNQVVFEMNAEKKRVRAGAEKSLESATECGKVDAGRAAPRKLSLAHFTTFVSRKGQVAKNSKCNHEEHEEHSAAVGRNHNVTILPFNTNVSRRGAEIAEVRNQRSARFSALRLCGTGSLKSRMPPLFPPYVYDRLRWEKTFPLKGYHFLHGRSPSASIVTSPHDLAINEQLRAERQADMLGYIAIPTDIFVFGIGEPERRDVTKIGGTPYRPANLNWPLAPDGRTMTFLAQFRFAESRDIIGPLPGDLLLVFIKEELPIYNDQSAFLFEWQNLGLAVEELVKPEDVPSPSWTYFSGFGARHRTVDVPNTQEVFRDVEGGFLLTALQGTKIGGVNPNWNRDDRKIEGQFLCSLGSICCAANRPYPWVNHSESMTFEEANERRNSLSWGDAGSLQFHIDGHSMIHWELSSY